MSVHVISWVLEHSPAELATRLVLLSLADHASKDGSDAYASVPTLQHEARLKSRRSVQIALGELRAARAIAANGVVDSGAVNYTVSMELAEQDWLAAKTYRESLRRGAESARGGGATDARATDVGASVGGGANNARGGAESAGRTECAPGGATDAREPSIGTVGGSSATAEDPPSSNKERSTAPVEEQVDVERELADYKHLLPFVDPLFERLVKVAAAKPGSITPTRRAVARLLRRMPNKDFLPVADRFEHYYLDGRARGKPVKDVVATFRNWLFKEPSVSTKTPPPSGVGAERSEQDARRRALAEDTRARLEAADR